jgi:hypothetical protein
MDEDEKAYIAAMIDRRVTELRRSGADDWTVLGAMSDAMPMFKRLLDACAEDDMEMLAADRPGFHDFAALLTLIAESIRSGDLIVTPGPGSN